MTPNRNEVRTAMVLRGGTVVDGSGAEPVRNGAVLVAEDGSIAYAGPESEMPQLPEDARRIDLSEHTVFPGFFDCHVHFILAALASRCSPR